MPPTVDSALNKRKRAEADDEEDPQSDAGDDPEEDEDEDEHVESKPKPSKARKSKNKPGDDGSPPVKKIRASAKNGEKRVPNAPKSRTPKNKKAGAEFDADKVGKETKVHTDIPLFSTRDNNLFIRARQLITRTDTILNPSAALQSTVEDFLESLEATPNPTQAELINAILRACGCNDSVDHDQVVDYDGIVDVLDDFSDVLKTVCVCILK